MNRHILRLFARPAAVLVAATVALAGVAARAQCPVTQLTSGLQIPLGITQSNQGNLIVSETGTSVPNTGRISIVDLNGNRRTLLDGLPSGINDVNEPSGPAGVFMRGRTLYVAIGVGDVGIAGPVPGTTAANPNPISSPIFSSVLAIHFSANAEKTTAGLTLTAANQLLVTLFRGFPFLPGSVVEQVDPLTGTHTPFITGLKTAIDILPISEGGDTDYFVLQHASGSGPFFTPPGLLLHFETPTGPPTIIANCLTRPTSMTLDEKTEIVYVTELGGRIVSIP